MNTKYKIQKQQGAALIVGLILLVVITVLAVSGMNTATTELAMARNDQNYENAFQAAETGLEGALAQGQFTTLAGVTVTKVINTNDSVTAQIEFEDSTLVPDRGFSLGVGSGVEAYHFLATAQAESLRSPGYTTDRDSSAVHTQAFYVVGPGSTSL
ncbi:MAG: pilus assembly PilX N-terminal domain-containing protein [Gammaproteobacteria bacterium]|nr:pilus assembly PilX N-terminal domain-containing protein [Gammaproteobacteria bacterium]MDH3415641.1 pilus assembly PilX N-terminal domain-containing protein [Gammaproteobacteria bacterium]